MATSPFPLTPRQLQQNHNLEHVNVWACMFRKEGSMHMKKVCVCMCVTERERERECLCVSLGGMEGTQLDTVLVYLASQGINSWHFGILFQLFCHKQKGGTLKELQAFLGHLNFACKVVKPGQAFSVRLTRATS